MSATESPVPQYAYSLDEERYYGSYATREDAIAGALDDVDLPGPRSFSVWTGRRKEWQIKGDSVARWLIDHLKDDAYDEAGEFSEDWLSNLSQGEIDAIGRKIVDAIMEIDPPQFWTVEDVERHSAKKEE